MHQALPASDGPMVSVLCITYNHAAFVARTLDSFLAQRTDFEVEIVVSDDCSTDSTGEIIEQYRVRAGGRIRVLNSPVNLGMTRNFRRAMQACRGKYIALCEGDDFWRGQTKLQTQVDFMQTHPEVVVTYHDATIVDEQGEHETIQLPPELRCDASREELQATRPISTLTACFRNVLGPWPPELDQAPALDLCLWSLLGHQGSGKYLPEIEPAGYRVHAGGAFSMQTNRTRRIMTAQSLLCLARIYMRQDKRSASNAVLWKAMRIMVIALLGLPENLTLRSSVLAPFAVVQSRWASWRYPKG
jgi:hypothetical protein